MILNIPIRSDLTAYRFRLDLDGVAYIFDVRYNEREDRWYADILDSDANVLWGGQKLIQGFPLFLGGNARRPEFPPGGFILLDVTGAARTPGREGLGTDYQLLYQDLN